MMRNRYIEKSLMWIALVVCLVPAAASADVWGFMPPTDLNANSPNDIGNDSAVSLANDGAGNWVAVWQSGDPLLGVVGTDADIFVARSSDNGTTWSHPEYLNSSAPGSGRGDLRPEVVTDGNGRWITVWQSEEDPGGNLGLDYDIFISRSTDNGATWTTQQNLNLDAALDDATYGDDEEPKLTTDGLGNWVAVWRNQPDFNEPRRAMVSYSTDHGQTWSYPVVIREAATQIMYGPRIATDASGTWVVVWGEQRDGDEDVYASRSTNGGTTWSAARRVNTNGSTDSVHDRAPDIAADQDGNWLVVWISQAFWPEWYMAAARSQDGGVNWTDPVQIDPAVAPAGTTESNPRLTTDREGVWVATWLRRPESGAFYDNDVMVSRSHDLGDTWLTPIAVNASSETNITTYSYPMAATDEAGTWILGWSCCEDEEIRITRVQPPVVESFSQIDDNPVDASTTSRVRYQLQFAEPGIYGAVPADFGVVNTGDVSGSWVERTFYRSGSLIEVTVVVGQLAAGGTGTLQLELLDDDTVFSRDYDAPLGGWGEGNGNVLGAPYIVDRPPSAISITRLDPNPTGAGSTVRYRAVFSEDVSGVDATDFFFATTGGVSGAYVTSITPMSATTYDVGVAFTATSNGSVGLNIVDDDTIVDDAGLPVGGRGLANGNFTGEIYQVDTTPPTPGTAVSTQGAVTTDSSQLAFSWSGFQDFQSGVDYYEVALGDPFDPEAYQPFTYQGGGSSATFWPGNFPGSFPGGSFTDGSYRFSVRAVNGVGLTSPAAEASVILDLTAPVVTSVTFGAQPDGTALTCDFSGSDGPVGSGIAFYEVAFGDTGDPLAYRGFTSVGLSTSVTFQPGDFPQHFTGNVFPDRDYVCTVRAMDAAGLLSAEGSGISLVDLSPPDDGNVASDEGGVTKNAKSLSFSWSAFDDPHSGIDHYEVAFGDLSDPERFQSFADVGTETTTTFVPTDFFEPGGDPIFPDAVFYDDQPDGIYVCTVRAVNGAGLVSTGASGQVRVEITRLLLGQEIEPPLGADVLLSTWDGADVFRVDHVGALFTRDSERYFNIQWVDGAVQLEQTYYGLPIPAQEPMAIYHTHNLDGVARTGAPQVDLESISRVTIHYNRALPDRTDGTPTNDFVWLDGALLSARERTGYVVLQYDAHPIPTSADDFIGVEVVDVRAYAPDGGTGAVDIGSRPQPQQSVPNPVTPVVIKGGPGSDTEYLYQHAIDSPQKGEVWAIDGNDTPREMEIAWMRTGLADIEWPYEIRQYVSDWPSDPGKMQLFVRDAESGVLGPEVGIPTALNARIVTEDFDAAQHAYLEEGGTAFYTDGPGWTLLQYGTGPTAGQDWVGFEVVHAVDHEDFDVYGTAAATVGEEIRDVYHEAAVTPYIHAPIGTRYVADVLAETAQVFAINTGELEVWWYHETPLEDREGPGYPTWPVAAAEVAWPSKAVRYTAAWPTASVLCEAETAPEAPCRIVIARQTGSGPFDVDVYGNDWLLYVQNDDATPGFNPNDEHAWAIGDTIYALRDDLGQPGTSEPWVLVQYREQSSNQLWLFRLMQVVAEEDPYFFHEWVGYDRLTDPYEWDAGLVLQPPYPVGILSGVEMEAVGDGPWYQDRNGNVYAMAAGADGVSSDDVTLHVSYALQSDFYFPDTLGAGYPHDPASQDVVPWLDGGTGTPVDVVYSAFWPDEPFGVLSIGQTVLDGGPGIGVINGRCSVAVVYDQGFALDGGSSVILADPLRARTATLSLAALPDVIRTERVTDDLGRNLDIFVDLSLALRERVVFDPTTGLLEMFGVVVDPTFGFDYPIVNVMGEGERDALCSLDDEDPEATEKCTGTEWDLAVESLYAATGAPETTLEVPWGSVALTGKVVPAERYVTVAFSDAEVCGDSGGAEPSLAILKVEPSLFVGQVGTIYPDCAFDERVSLRHSGDFGGRPEQYVFEWLNWSDPTTTPDTPVGDDPPGWLDEVSGRGVNEVVIEGAGVRTLRDAYLTVRYGPDPDGDGTPSSWSDWTDPAFSEGWIKRVVGDINGYTQGGTSGGVQGGEILGPIEQSFYSYGGEIDTVVNMISKAGERWTGDVPLSCRDLDLFGLIEIYETVLNRGADLSINASVDDDAANQALLLVASRIADLYTLLGNEAFADASDPTIGWVDQSDYGSESVTSVHAFANVTGSLLEEELGLLRGRDDSHAPGVELHPLYNRLAWNYTNGLTGGEIAYSLNYNVHDANDDGVIDEDDAKQIFPQGHGDAWGHYLTALSSYYELLRHPNYTWQSRAEAVQMGGEAFTVDYYDERKFAQVAAGKARVGAEIVNLTYRDAYVADPAGQWQGYRDIDPERAWGVSEWASRAGQGAYFDWVTGNAILPDIDPVSCDREGADPTSCHSGVEEIDRRKVLELRELASRHEEIQAQIDVADVGLNPLGLATNAIPFDIEPTEIDAGNTHFEQIYDRAVGAMNNAIAVFEHANSSTRILRRQAESAEDFQTATDEREIDFRNRLIEAFGYPYSDDIGAGRTYSLGYDGPDLVHYNMVDVSELLGVIQPEVTEIPVVLATHEVSSTGAVTRDEQEVVFYIASSAEPFGEVKPASWTGERRAPGEIQRARSELLQARNRLQKGLQQYDDLMASIDDQVALMRARHSLDAEEIRILNYQSAEQERLADRILAARAKQLDFRGAARIANIAATASAEILPTAVGFSNDVTAPARGAIRLLGSAMSEFMSYNADRAALSELEEQQALQEMQAGANIALTTARTEFALLQQIEQLEQIVRQETALRLELFNLQQATQQAVGRYRSVLAQGLRLLEDRDRFRRQTAAEVQERRYKDMAFRIFRNDALQKYRAQYDLAARYVYLAAKAYDFETGLLATDFQAGSRFLTEIVRARLIGTIGEGGIPQTGGGLADPMARMSANFAGLKGQLGFNNPQRETNRFSLRSELFRVRPGYQGNTVWRETLRRHIVPNLLELPEFQRYARIFEPHAPVEPAIVIPFETSVHFGLNFFGWPAGGGDNAYDSTNFATKVRSVGVWFSNYDNLSMVNTPRVYLIPVGEDVIRSPSGGGVTRSFQVLDQKLPASFEVGAGDLASPDWIPMVDGLRSTFAEVRKYSSFRAYHDAGQFDPGEASRDSRLVGRSVWNSRWLLVIPAGTLLFDRQEGLNRFIDGMPFGDGRDGNGVTDILIFFETYAYSGN